MADNTDDKHLDNPINTQSENLPDEIIPTPETETINPNQETENMEVHHHAHNPAEPHHKKNWKSYFWEFLMLFLAVFCGFLAEYQLEHKIERDRGKQFVQSFFQDLKVDTTNINNQIKMLELKLIASREIFKCYDSVTQKASSTECLKEIILNSQGFADFIYTDRTIQQLKYAGGLRLIQDKEIADSIIKYDAIVREMLIHQQTLENQQQNVVDAHNSMIGFIQLQKLILPNIKVKSDLFLLTNDKRELNKYFNEIATFIKGCYGQLVWLKQIKARATRILIFIDKKNN
jgi:hypothetical protein